MLLSCEGQTLSLADQYVQGSPFLSTMIASGIGMTTIHTSQGDAILLESFLKAYAVKEYLKYLQGRPFYMNDVIETVFSYMGHDPRENGKDIRLWKAELHDQWHRDNFERLSIWGLPISGLLTISLETLYSTSQNHPGCTVCITGNEAIMKLPQAWRRGAYTDNLYLRSPVHTLIGKPPNGEYLCNDDTFVYNHLACYRKTYRSVNEIAFFSPTSGGIVAVDRHQHIYLTHVAYYNFVKDVQNTMNAIHTMMVNAIPMIHISDIRDSYHVSMYDDDYHVPIVLCPKDCIITLIEKGYNANLQRKEHISF